jgi:hypothetical protein
MSVMFIRTTNLGTMSGSQESATLQEKFHATAVLLSQLNHSNQQRPEPRSTGHHVFKNSAPSGTFLDRLAWVLACWQRLEDVANNVCASAFVCTRNGKPRIYLAKNRESLYEEKILAPALQQWMRDIAICGTYEMLVFNTIIVHNGTLIDFYIGWLSQKHTAQLTAVCMSARGKDLARVPYSSCTNFWSCAGTDSKRRSILRHAAKLRNMLQQTQLKTTHEGCYGHWATTSPHTGPSQKPHAQTNH